MNPSTELNVTAEALPLPQSTLGRWYKATLSTRHTPNSGLNNLADSSTAAFEYIYLLAKSPISNELRKNIEESLEALQKHYQQLGYSQDISLAAHYAVCATFDDMMRCAGNEGRFLQTFHSSQLEQEKFYSILEHISAKTDQYIDLLELMYLCLRFGYKGQYRNTPFGLQQWSLLTNNTYHLITQVRGQRSHTLSPGLKSHTPQKSPPVSASVTPKKQHSFYFQVILLFIILAISIGFVFRETYKTTRQAFNTHSVITPHQESEITT